MLFCNIIKFHLAGLFFLAFQIAFSQEIPPLKDFVPGEYKADNQNWAITQDSLGKMYFANNAGLLTYNGAEWKLFNTPNGSAMRSVKEVNNRIYVGLYMEFGYYFENKKGILEYNSISNSFKTDLLEDEQFWQIEQYKDWILFRSLKRIYLYNVSTNTYKHYSTKNSINHLSIIDDTIYYHISNEGIYTLQEGEQKLYASHSILKNTKIVNLFSHTNEALVAISDKKGVFVFNDKEIKPLNAELNAILGTNSIYTSLKLRNEKLIIGTISSGVFIVDAKGNIEYKINQGLGLTNNTILSLFEDKTGDLWLGTDYGINYLNTNTTLKVYNDRKGVLGTVYDAINFKGQLYLGTNQGLFYMPNKELGEYKMIPNTSGQVWTLFEYNGTLFCGHDSGTFVIRNNQAIKIADIDGSWLFRPLSANGNLLIQGNYNGLSVLQQKDNNWVYRNKIEGFDFSSQFFEIIGNKIIVNHEFKGVYALELNDDFTEFTSVKKIAKFQQNQASGLNSYRDRIYYASKQGFYSYDIENEKFLRNDSISSFISNDFESGRMSVNNSGIWMFQENGLVNLKQGQFSKQLEFNKKTFPVHLFTSKKGFQKLTEIKDKTYLIGSHNGYAVTNFNDSKQELNVAISEVRNISNTNNLNGNLSIKEEQEFLYKDNGFQITYAAHHYNAVSTIRYQTRLLGRSDVWSNWSTNYTTKFENLSSGKYTFQVRAKVENVISNNIATYSFTIAKPWYFSNMAIAIYTAIFLLSAYFIHISYKRHYKKQRERLLERNKRVVAMKVLESNQKIINIEKEQLQKDVENKNRELAISTMSLIKKNKLLSGIKKELLSTTELKSDTKSVIKTIDRNLNNNNDWEFFEEAFNNADSDFLKKIKLLHSNLTPNDLRLCAYLRLNLSSKEVAPLLNISPRSVEIKRYRLRKKINLPHEKSLVGYILEV